MLNSCVEATTFFALHFWYILWICLYISSILDEHGSVNAHASFSSSHQAKKEERKIPHNVHGLLFEFCTEIAFYFPFRCCLIACFEKNGWERKLQPTFCDVLFRWKMMNKLPPKLCLSNKYMVVESLLNTTSICVFGWTIKENKNVPRLLFYGATLNGFLYFFISFACIEFICL